MKLYVIGEDKRRKECITLLLQKTPEETEKKSIVSYTRIKTWKKVYILHHIHTLALSFVWLDKLAGKYNTVPQDILLE